MNTKNIIYKLKKSHEVLLELLHIRGFSNIKKKDFNIKDVSILEEKLLSNKLCYSFKKSSKKSIYIHYLYNVSAKIIDTIIAEIYNNTVQLIFIIIGNIFITLFV